MPRKWTSRKLSTLDESAIAAGTFARAYPLDRAGPEPAAGNRQVLRLLTVYTLFWLPVHCGICVLSAHSLGLAVGGVILAAVALLLIALAKRLAIDDLFQWLPLLFVLGLVVLGVAFLVSRPPQPSGLAGIELFGTVVVLVTIVSILGSLHRPLSTAYQAVVAKTTSRDLGVGAIAILVSLAMTAFAQAVPRPVFAVMMSTVCGGFAGLVVIEYAAWARANPHVDLARTMAFDAPTERRGPRSTFEGACYVGLGRGLVVFGLFYTVFPSPQMSGVLRYFPSAARDGEAAVLGCWAAVGLLVLMAGYSLVNGSLSAPFGSLTAAGARAGFRLSWDALRVFLTYPEAGHPLTHRLRLRWLRPVAVRHALTGLVLATVATTILTPSEKPTLPEAVSTPAMSAATVPPATHAPRDTHAITTDLIVFVVMAIHLAVTPLLVVYGSVWLVGLSVLPTYARAFEGHGKPK